jgi:dephospho-CoA kinase
MLTVGLTGGIGSGKSTVSSHLVSLGATVIDYDVVARQIVEPGMPALAAIAQRFGADVIAADGTMDRAKVGAIVFADPSALEALNAITHPAIHHLVSQQVAAAPAGAVVVHDNPLLVEMGAASRCDVVVVVDVPIEVQVQRLMANRGMTEDEALARINAQATREQRTGVADEIIDNTGSVEDLRTRVEHLWQQWQLDPRVY